MHPFEVAFLRNVFGLVVLSPLFLRSGFSVLRTSKLKLHAMRGVLQTAGMLIFFTALTLAPLTEVVALSFTSPLFATVLAILILREKRGFGVGRRCWRALRAPSSFCVRVSALSVWGHCWWFFRRSSGAAP